MINSIFWNCRGIGNSPTVNHLKKLLKKFNVDFVAIFEPKLQEKHIARIMQKLGMSHCWCNSSSQSHIWIFWHNIDSVVLLSEMSQASSFKIEHKQVNLVITCEYAALESCKRRDLWSYVLDISDSISVPWCVGGDFNVISSPSEAKGNFSFDYPAADDFNDFINTAGFSEMEIYGDDLSWSNLRNIDELMFKKLDRILVNNAWRMQFELKISYELMFSSDHKPMIVDKLVNVKTKPSRFVFQKMWLSHPNFLDFLNNFWKRSFSSCHLFNLAFKLKRLKEELKRWNVEVFGDINKRYAKDMSQLAVLENVLQNEWSEDAVNALREKKREVLMTELQLETFQRQKSRETWLLEGDRNSKYFHAMVKERKKSKYLDCLEETLKQKSDFKSVLDEGRQFYSNLLSSEGVVSDVELLSVIPSLVSEEHNSSLTSVPDDEEIKFAVFSTDQSPSPDGFPAGFYHQCWDVVCSDVISTVKEFFKRSFLPKPWKSTFIALIPKTDCPTSFKDMRPISLCSVHYKFISKILSNRLSKFMSLLISDEQGAYVQGKNIHESICLVQEMVQHLNSGKSGGNLVVKLDMPIAYDRLEWSFLECVLEKFGFSAKSINLLRQCYAGNSFSVLIEGESSGFFQSSRGVRQGDPISPLLFVLAAEVLSRDFKNLILSGSVKRYHVPSCDVLVSHSLFADDCGKSSLINFMSWERITAKYEEGGLNIRDLRDVSDALRMKLVWSLIQGSSTWSKFMLNRYGDVRVSCVSEVDGPAFWKKLQLTWLKFKHVLSWEIGSGDVKFWTDRWAMDTCLQEFAEGDIDVNVSVQEALKDISGFPLPSEITVMLQNLNICTDDRDDICIWTLENNGKFSVKSAWREIRAARAEISWGATI